MAPAHSGLHATDCRFVCCRNAKRWWWCSSHCRLSPGKPMRMQPVPLCLLNVLRPSASSTAVDVWIAISNWLVHHQVCCCLVTTVAASVQRHTQKIGLPPPSSLPSLNNCTLLLNSLPLRRRRRRKGTATATVALKLLNYRKPITETVFWFFVFGGSVTTAVPRPPLVPVGSHRKIAVVSFTPPSSTDIQ